MAKINRVDNRIYRFDFSGVEEPTEEIQQEPVKKRVTPRNERSKSMKYRLNAKERKFCREYVKNGNATQAYIDAGYTASTRATAGVEGCKLLKMPKIAKEIQRLQMPEEKEAIATAVEVMEMLTAIARGEDTDQFGLELSADTRMKALVELAKRTVDLDNRLKLAQSGEDNTITVKLTFDE